MAFFDTTWYVNFGNGTTTGYYAVPQHAASTAYTAGQIVRQFTTPAVGNERCFVCIVAGTSAAAADATWVLTRGAKTTDGTITWMECTGATAMNGDLTNTQSWAQVKAIGSAVTLGQIIKRNNAASYQMCTLSSGNTGATEPAFSDTPGATTVDGSATWTCLGLVGSFSNGGAPHARLANVFVGGWFASGNTIYVGDNHAETQATTIALTPSSALLAKILCHNHSGSYPPAASDITTGATIAVSAAVFLQINGQGSFYYYGISFQANSVSAAIQIAAAATVTQVQNWFYFDNCSFIMGATSGQGISLGNTGGNAWQIITFNNTTVKFAAVGIPIITQFCQLTWQNTGPILVSGSSVPTTLFSVTTACRFNNITLTNLDLSQLTGSLFTNASNSSIGTLLVQDCKLNAAMSVTTPINSGMRVEFLRSDSAGTSYKSQRITYEGIETTETTVVRTGGAVDPSGQAQSRKIVTSTTAEWLRPYKAEPLAIWNATVGVPVTVTVCGLTQATILPYTDELWLEVEYLADASSTLGTIVSTTKSNLLAGGSPVAVDSSVWATPAFIPVTWDPATVTAVTLSGGNLVTTNTGTTSADQGAHVVSTSGKTSGKYYVEMTWTTIPGGIGGANMGVGVGTAASTYTNMGNGGTTGVLHYRGGSTWSNGSQILATGGGWTQGQVAGIAIDLDNRKFWFRASPSGQWNNSGANDPSANVGGLTIPAGTMIPFVTFGGTSGVANNVLTVNFGASAFTGTVPSGFASGWPQ